MRWLIALTGVAAAGGIGACALVSGLSDYAQGTADASLVDVRVHPTPTPDGGSPETDDSAIAATDSPVGDDASPVSVEAASCESPVNDPLNCGACGAACDTANSQDATCLGTMCTYSGCNPDWLDCDQTPPNTNGCESSKTSTTSCGACGNVCDTTHSLGATCVAGDGGAIVCQYSGCQLGWADCDTSGVNTNGCETSLATPGNCGACGKKCDTAKSQGASCDDGQTCQYTGCNSGYADCNTTAPDTDGCETQVANATCNACGTSCDTAHSSGASCQMGSSGATCTYTSCASGYANCNKTPPDTNGCETQITTASNCGSCGTSCDTAHSTGASCQGSGSSATCKYTGCAAGYADCSNTAPNTNGCESSLSSTATCGGCSNACSTKTGAASCNGTTCTYQCNSGLIDCNGSKAPNTDGCECATPMCCGTGCQTTHSDGLGQNFYDCNQQGSHNQAQAQAACAAYTGNPSACTPSSTCCGINLGVCLGTTAQSVCGSAGGKCYCWQYSGQNPGKVESESGNCSASCGSGNDPSWN